MKYDAIIVGTGFGGTIAASILSKAGVKNILLLERGTWWFTPEKLGKPPQATAPPLADWAKQNGHPVQYWPRPEHKEGLLDLFASIRHGANPHGLYNYRAFKDVHVLTASGVGGGSLIYSNVTLRPQDDVLDQLETRGLTLRGATDYYAAAYAWMGKHRGQLSKVVTKIPLPGRNVDDLGADDYLYLDRSRTLRDAAASIRQFDKGGKAHWNPLDLAITEYDRDAAPDKPSDSSRFHTFCERQGRCFLGCLPGARHTLNKTLYSKFLSKPELGVTLWPLAEARYIERQGPDYAVTFYDHRDEEEKTVTAPQLFLGGGVLGTTELLLRSRDRGGLPLGDAVGSRFSTNGDFAAFALGTKSSVFSTRGPINTCHLQVNYDGTHITIEDCAIPPMFAAVASTALQSLDNFLHREMFRAKMVLSWKLGRLPDFSDLLPLFPDTYDPGKFRTEPEMVQNTFFFNGMGQDDANGRFFLHHDRLDVKWDTPLADQAVFQKMETLVRTLAEEGMGGKYIPSPLWEGLADRKAITVHPLGGCPIGLDNRDGVVDEYGRVFDCSKPPGAKDVLPGLYIVDGSVIPGALAVNPSLTISAQALKTMSRAVPRTESDFDDPLDFSSVEPPIAVEGL